MSLSYAAESIKPLHYYYPPLIMVNCSCAISIVSTATSLPSDLRSVLVIFVGHALFNCHWMLILAFSSSSFITMVLRFIVFIEISLCHFQKLLSLTNTPFFMVIFPYLVKPGIFCVEKVGLLLLRYSMIWFSTSIPDTSWKATPFKSSPKSTSNLNFGMGQGSPSMLPSSLVILLILFVIAFCFKIWLAVNIWINKLLFVR